MTALVIERRSAPAARAVALPIALACAVVAFSLRDVGPWSFVVPVVAGTGVLLTQTRVVARPDASTWIAVTGVGMAACAVVRFALPGVPLHATTLGLLASAAAGVGEEIVFRRGLYGALERWGPPIAIVVSALAFGLVHVPMYGWTVVPVDVAAGAVFGWQRWTTGGWTSSAATHAFANVLGSL